MSRERLALWVAIVGGVVIGGVGFGIYLRDGSYYQDEASVVLSFAERGVFEAFAGPLAGGGQSFPRFYFLAIRGVRALFGPETWATRLLPHFAFLVATGLWMRLFRVRFRDRPALVLLGVLLVGMAPSWWLYSAVVKQYTLDVLLTLVIFSVPDRVLDEALLRRHRLGRLLALLVPILFSYTYGVAVLARGAGWLLLALRRGERPDARSMATLALGLGAALALLWAVDARHSVSNAAVIAMWQSTILSQHPDQLLPILLRSVREWYTGPTEFIWHPGLAAPALWALLVCGGLGVVRVVLSLARPDRLTGSPARAEWGSRSVGCVLAILGLIATSFVLDYPIKSGRTTLYVLCLQQMLMLEGVEWIGELARRIPRLDVRRVSQAVLALALAAGIVASAATAAEVARRVLAKAPVDNVRPLLARIRSEPDLPVLVTVCMGRQVQTLPEGLDGHEVIVLPASDWKPLVPLGRDVWIIHSRLLPGLCEQTRRQLRRMTHGFDRADVFGETAVVYRAKTLTRAELRQRRRRERQQREDVDGEREE